MKAIHFLFFVITTVYLVSCGEKKVPETIDLEEFLPQSNYKPKEISEQKKEDTLLFLDGLANYLPEDFKLDKSQSSTSLMIERFNFLSRENLSVSNEEDKWEVFYWSFVDSLTTWNAFFNWLDCFGPNCNSLIVGEENSVKGLKNFYLSVSDTMVLFWQGDYSRLFEKAWDDFLENNLPEKEWKYKLQQRRGKMEWLEKSMND